MVPNPASRHQGGEAEEHSQAFMAHTRYRPALQPIANCAQRASRHARYDAYHPVHIHDGAELMTPVPRSRNRNGFAVKMGV